MSQDQENWFYIKGGERQGPVTLSSLKSRYESGNLLENTLVWTPSFGDEWKQIDKVSSMRSSSEPPLVPSSEIPSHWLYLLISLPVVMSFFEALLLGSNPTLYESDGATGIAFLLYFIPNTICAKLDQNAIEKSGRKDAARGLLFWIIILIPVYIYLRSKRTGKSLWLMLAWIGSFAASVFVTEIMASDVYLGVELPQCDTRATLRMVEQIYPDIPINLVRAQVIDVAEIQELHFSNSNGLRECYAVVENSIGLDTPINYSIKALGDEFYYEVWYAGF